jgi:hypothetical protein
MAPEGSFVARMMNGKHREIAALKVWAARYEDGPASTYWHRAFARACRDVLPAPHDLVVPEGSCLGAGVPQGPLSVPSTHFDYFALAEIHDYLRREVA